MVLEMLEPRRIYITYIPYQHHRLGSQGHLPLCSFSPFQNLNIPNESKVHHIICMCNERVFYMRSLHY